MHFVSGSFCYSCCLSASICPWTFRSSKNQNHLSTQKLLEKKIEKKMTRRDVRRYDPERMRKETARMNCRTIPSIFNNSLISKKAAAWTKAKLCCVPFMRSNEYTVFGNYQSCHSAEYLHAGLQNLCLIFPSNQQFLGAFVFVSIRNVSATARNILGGESIFI